MPIGGAKRVLYEEIKGLSKRHKIHLFTTLPTDRSEVWAVEPYVNEVFRFDVKIESQFPGVLARIEKDFQNFVKLALVHKRIAKKINEDGYDVVLVHADRFTQSPFLLRYLEVPSAYYCMELLRIAYEEELMFEERVIFVKRLYELVTREIRRGIDSRNARSASLIISISRFVKGDVKKAYKKESVICYPGVDTNIFKPSSKRKENVILYVGSKIELEGYGLAKQGFETAKRIWIERTKSDFKFKFKVITFGRGGPRLTDAQLSKEYSKAFITLSPSLNETFGLIPLESIACKTPAIALNEAAFKETTINGKTGFLLSRDSEEIGEKIVYLIRHPEVVKRVAREGRKHVMENFTWKKHVHCLEKKLVSISNNKV